MHLIIYFDSIKFIFLSSNSLFSVILNESSLPNIPLLSSGIFFYVNKK